MKAERIYLAAPWFNPAQAERYDRVLNVLRAWEAKAPDGELRSLYVPRENPCPPDGTAETRREIYRSNVDNIKTATRIVAITDEKDIGTIYELGYAARLKEEQEQIANLLPKPPVIQLVGVALSLPPGAAFNLMLAEGLDAVCKTTEELWAYLTEGVAPRHEGIIE